MLQVFKNLTRPLKDRFVIVEFIVQNYSVNTIVPIPEFCNSIAIKNAGTTVLTAQDDPLQAGDTKSIGGQPYSILRQKHLNLVFSGVGTNLAVVTFLYYTGLDQEQ